MKNLSQYKQLAFFLWKYGNSNLVKNAGLLDVVDGNWVEEEQTDEVAPSEMVEDLQDMGPAFIKMGQLLSTRPDLLPAPYIDALANLQDKVEPFSFQEVEEIVQSELGVRISKAFKYFEKEPIASASLGQVHLAELRNGETVVVKVQRPNIRKKILEELEVLESTADFLEQNTEFGRRFAVNKLFQQFKKTLLRELNYLKEAEHIRILKNNLLEYPRIVIPAPVEDYTSDKVLTMKYLKGRKITEIPELQKLDLDGKQLAEDLFKAYMKQILIDGFVHADPHPGNVHIMEDDRIALLDFGMVAHVPKNLRNKYLKLFLNVGSGNADVAVNILLDMSETVGVADEKQFRTTISELILENQNTPAKNLQTGRILLDTVQVAGQTGFLLPVEMSMIGKTLLNLDQVARTIAPDFNPNEVIQDHAMSLMNKHMLEDLTSHNFLSALLESKEFVGKLPERLNKLFHNAAENEIELKIDAFDEKHMMQGFQKIANRITVGLILASLIMGSALLMQIETSFTLFGYPGLAMIAFLTAVMGSGVLAFRIFISDESADK